MNSKGKRKQAKGWILEWQISHISKEATLEKLLDISTRVGQLNYAVVVKATKSLKPAMYAFVQYKRKTTFQHNKWDISHSRGIYKPQRSWKSILPYMGVTNWISYGINIEQALKKKRSRLETYNNH